MFIKSKKEKDAICKLKGLLGYLETSRDSRRELIMSDDDIIYGECDRRGICIRYMKADLDLTIKRIRAIVKDL